MAHPPEKRSARRVSDEELEYYGQLFLDCKLREAGVDFETFLNNPEYYLAKHPRRAEPRRGTNDGGGRKGLRDFLRLRSTSRTSSD